MDRHLNLARTVGNLAVLLLCMLVVPTAVLAGNTHTEAGPVLESAGVPELDGVGQVNVYWTGISSQRATATVGATLAGHWMQDVGFKLGREWLVGDEHVAVLEHQTGAGSTSHSGYYGVIHRVLTSFDPDVYPAMTVRAIQVPQVVGGAGYVDLAWTPAPQDTADIAGYRVHRSTNGIAFTLATPSVIASAAFRDSAVTFGTVYYYATSLVFRGTPAYEGSALSANSQPVTPLDMTPPDVPVLAAEPSFTSGTGNELGWSNEQPSGASEYLVEGATDEAFANVVAVSAWISTTTHTFTGLQDGVNYWYRVRARDAQNNESAFSVALSSQQDAAAPTSNLLALTGFKTTAALALEWTASDTGSGVTSVHLHYAKDGGASVQYPGGPFTTSPIAFDASTTGGDGAYALYTVSTDAVGNTEASPETPDASFAIDTQAPGAPLTTALPSFTAGASCDVAWNDESSSGAAGYRVQAALTPTFDVVLIDSNWLASTSHTFTGLADGEIYYYRVQSRDTAGNESGFGSSASSTQDASAPQTSVEALPAFSTPTVDIAWNGSDAASGLVSVELYYSKDGGAYALVAGGPFATSPIAFDATPFGDGEFTFYTLGTDAVANIESAPATADAATTVDTQAPAAPSVATLPDFTAGDELALGWSNASTTGATAYLAQVASDPSFTILFASSDWTSDTSFTFSGLSDATTYYYRVKARDAAGNETVFSTAAASTQDATPASSQALALAPLSSTTTFQIAWTGTDATSGLSSVDLWCSKDGGPFIEVGGPFTSSPIAFDAATAGGDGTYAFYTRARDAVGNLEAAAATADAQTVIDTNAPGAPSIAAVQAYTAGSAVALGWSDESASGAIEYLAQMSALANFASIDADTGWTSGASHTFTGLADGTTYYFRVRARDGALNATGFSGVKSTTMDATAPESNVEPLAAIMMNTEFDIAWNSLDATSGTAAVQLYVSHNGQPFVVYPGGPFATSPIAFDASQVGDDGNYAFYTRATDNIGNTEALAGAPDAMTVVDTQAPEKPTIASPPAFMAGSTLALDWSDESASGATAYLAQAATDATFANLASASGWQAATSHVFTSLADSQTYHFRVQARDAAGNEGPFSTLAAVTMDAATPASAVAGLPTFSPSSFSVAWTASDATSGVQHVDLYISKDGAAFQIDPNGPYTTSPVAFAAALHGGDGTYAFQTQAVDRVGNREAAAVVADAETHIDTVAPSAPVLALLPQFVAGTQLGLEWSNESAGGVVAYRAQAAANASFAAPTADTGWVTTTQHMFTGLADATTYFYRVWARDAAGNETAFSTVASATQDAMPPSSQIGTLPALTATSTTSLHWNAFDNTSGVQNVDLYFSKDGVPFALYAGGPFAASPIAFDAVLAGGDGVYSFFTRARDASGNVEAAPATADAQTRIDSSAPNAPAIAGLPSFAPGSTIVLGWSNESASGASEYRAEMARDAGFTTVTGTSGWIPSTSFVFSGLNDAVTVYFRVRARDAALHESANATLVQTTLDDTPPASQVSALPPVVNTATFALVWTGSDATSGIAAVDLYYAQSGGAYALYPGGPFSSSPIAFDVNAAAGEGEYAFYTRARDAVGNREPAPAAPDASTVVSTAAVGVAVLDAMPAYSQGTSRLLTWSAANGASAYLVQAAEDAAFTAVIGASGWIGTTSHRFDGLTDGRTYYYRVRARNQLGVEGAYSPLRSTTQDATRPASQAATLPSTSPTAFDVAWSATDATSGIASIELLVARNGGTHSVYPGGPFTTSPVHFDATSAGGDGDYAFYTVATDNAGNVESSPSAADAMTRIDTQAPPAPNIIAEPAITPGTTNAVSWNAVADAIEYQVQCADDALFSSIVAVSSWIAATSHTFTGLDAGITYFYRVRARDAALNSGSFSPVVFSMQSPGRDLQPGWNLISIGVTPEDPRIDRVLASLAGSYTIVRSYGGGQFLTYLPTLPIELSDLQTMSPLAGYWIYMTRQDRLEVSGTPISVSTPIGLEAGWELVGYLGGESQSPSAAFLSIDAALVVARGYAPQSGYRSYYTAHPALSDLASLDSGQGYWLYLSAPDELVYSNKPAVPVAGDDVRPGPARRIPSPVQQSALKSGTGTLVPSVMDVWSFKVTLDGAALAAPAVVDAFTNSGELIGSGTLHQDGALGILHLSGDVSITNDDEGALAGEAVVFKLRNVDASVALELVWDANATAEIELAFASAVAQLPKVFNLGQNTPNPFNPATTISYSIPATVDGQAVTAARVELRIFDIQGRVVRTLVSARQAPGQYTARWDGRDQNGAHTVSGVYFYRLQSERFSQTRKMMLVQ